MVIPKWGWLLFVFLIILSGEILWHWWRLAEVPVRYAFAGQPKSITHQTLTIFIHGYLGNRFSFGPMLRRFHKRGWAAKTFVIRVTPQGKLLVKGKPQLNWANPTVQVIFQNQTADENQQSQWLNSICHYLAKLGYQQVNFVAHSMGGISVLRYLLDTAEKALTPKKLIMLGVPFNDLEIGRDTPLVLAYRLTEQGPIKKAPIYQALLRDIERLSEHLQVLNVAGDTLAGAHDDGSVSVASSFSLQYLLAQRVDRYREVTIRGPLATHRLLHENSLVDINIKTFLWP